MQTTIDTVFVPRTALDELRTELNTLAVLAQHAQQDALARRIHELSGRIEGYVSAPGGVVLDHERQTVLHHGKTIRLTQTEWRVLAMLYAQRGVCVPRVDLALRIWGYCDKLDMPNISMVMRRLRQKLDGVVVIANEINKGYTLTICEAA